MQPSIAILLVFIATAACADGSSHEIDGHTKLRLIGRTFPSDSVFRNVAGSESFDLESDLRLNFRARSDHWSFDTAYQLILLYSDSVEWTGELDPIAATFVERLPSDSRRLFNLTDVIYEEGKTAIVQRLDRLFVGYTSEKIVVRFGRQALSWGNGLFYSPMDLVNPFDPAAIDTEFKAGDDMLYTQYLRDNGDDVQAAVVFRRDPISGDVESDLATSALKYHGIAGDNEYDVLVAESYGDVVLGIGGVKSIGGAVLRADLTVTNTDDDTYALLVTNLSHSWVWGGRNVSAAIEYFFNGFGQHDQQYDPASLMSNPDLLERLLRRELFTLGRNYLAGSLMIELSPLWTVTPTVFANISDPSALLQIMTSYSLSDNTIFLGSINLPLGADGTEFGGVSTGMPDQYLSTGWSVFAQMAWYF